MQPDVTFIVAAYNAEGSIARAIASALDQRDVSVEVVVADDCSSDRTVEIARSFPEPLVRVVQLSSNRGPGGARNAGLEIAAGRWIAVLDSDDVVRPDRLLRMTALGTGREADIVVDNLEVVQEVSGDSEVMFAEEHLAALSEISLADFIASNVIFRSTFNFGYMKPVFRREFLVHHGLRYDEALRVGEDYIFLASALAKGARCVVDPRPGYVYHIRKGSISRVLEGRHVAAMIAADAKFEMTYVMDADARKAFARRRRSLEEAASFISLVQHLKEKSLSKAIGVALRDPAAVRHLKMPIAVRLQRIAGPFAAWKTH